MLPPKFMKTFPLTPNSRCWVQWYYGGQQPQNISHVLFSNGDLDAWSLLSVTSYPPNNLEVYAEVWLSLLKRAPPILLLIGARAMFN